MDVTQQPKYIILDKTDMNNGFGATVQQLKPIGHVNGYLDMLTGVESKTNNVSLEESTHVFLTTYRKDIKRGMVLEDEEGNQFEVTYVDNPVTLGHHLEVYLVYINEPYKKKTGFTWSEVHNLTWSLFVDYSWRELGGNVT